jgi:hypothetical protein
MKKKGSHSKNTPEELKILSGTSFGYGVGGKSWERALNWDPDVIVAQGTSSDGGPTYLGSDAPLGGFGDIKKDLRTIIVSAKNRGIPFILSAGGPGGGNNELERSLGFVNEIAEEAGINLKIAVIPGEIDKEYLKRKIRGGAKIRRLVNTDSLPEYLTEEDVDASERIAAQMGPEPVMQALDLDVDGVITGRSLDVGLYMALPLKRGFDKGLTAHLAKSIECSGQVTVPQSFEAVFGILRKDHFLVKPTNPDAVCTVVSIAAHAFYERPDPNHEENPGGALDITGATYEQLDESTVKVSGSRWVPAPYTLKIEGARKIGYRTISICGIRDEQLISCIDRFLEDAREHARERLLPLKPDVDYDLMFRIYGKNGVLGEFEPVKQTKSHELGLIIDAVAGDEDLADKVCGTVAGFLLHADFPGRLTTAANIAFPYSPTEHRLGPVYVYNIWHVLELDDPCEPFHISIREFPAR